MKQGRQPRKARPCAAEWLALAVDCERGNGFYNPAVVAPYLEPERTTRDLPWNTWETRESTVGNLATTLYGSLESTKVSNEEGFLRSERAVRRSKKTRRRAQPVSPSRPAVGHLDRPSAVLLGRRSNFGHKVRTAGIVACEV